MNPSPSLPNPDSIYGLYTGSYKSHIIRVALLLDVFTPLVGGAADARTVAESCGCSAAGVRALLDYLCSLHLLNREGNAYALTPTAATFLVPGQKTYAGDWVLAETDPKWWDTVLHAVQSGQPTHHSFPWVQDAWLESYRAARVDESLEMWRAAGIKPGGRKEVKILDLACGSAIKSLSLAQKNPKVEVTCVDREDVLEVTRDLAARMGVGQQIELRAGDVLSVDLCQACFDAVVLGQITFYLSPTQNQDLYRRLFSALARGGALVIDAARTTDHPTEESSLLTFLTWAIDGGAAYSFAEYNTWLTKAGFQTISEINERWLAATKL
jgi:2-polyprenyl-3-methyl-5-hydroxy-6-metoxy-1,4-benzoquinol methylase